VVAEALTVIACDDDKRAIGNARISERTEHPPEVMVDLAHQAVIRGPNPPLIKLGDLLKAHAPLEVLEHLSAPQGQLKPWVASRLVVERARSYR